MKKLLSVFLSIIMTFSLCIPAFAEETVSNVSGLTPEQLKMVGDMLKDGTTVDENGKTVVKNLSTVRMVKQIVQMVDPTVTSLAMFNDVLDELCAGNYIDEKVRDAWKEAFLTVDNEPTTSPDQSAINKISEIITALGSTPSQDEIINAATQIVGVLKDEFGDISSMKTLIDELHNSGIISDTLYDEIIKQIDAIETTTEPTTGGGSGGSGDILDKINGFFSGIIDFILGLFGGGGGDTPDPTEPEEDVCTCDCQCECTCEYCNGECACACEGLCPEGECTCCGSESIPETGDIALVSVAGVALLAGIALVLTRKKENS